MFLPESIQSEEFRECFCLQMINVLLSYSGFMIPLLLEKQQPITISVF